MADAVAFPMYDINRHDTQALRLAVGELLVARGFSVRLAQPECNLLSHWQARDLLLSQTCGYPLMTQLPDVQTVGCFHYSAPGCDGLDYRSMLVARRADRHKTLADFRGRRAACNSADSHSGYNVLLKMIAPLAERGEFFAEVVFSGSHRQSLLELSANRADIAAIDCVTCALLQRHQPALFAELAIVGCSPQAPGLPLITSANVSAEALGQLREALRQLVSLPQYREICAALFISGFSKVSRQRYSTLLEWRDEARSRGVRQL